MEHVYSKTQRRISTKKATSEVSSRLPNKDSECTNIEIDEVFGF